MTVPGPPPAVLAAILVQNESDPGSPMSRATFSQSGEPPFLPTLMNDVVVMPQDAVLDASGTWTSFLSTTGLTGATAPTRWVGATASGAPVTGTFAVGDFIISGDGNAYVCTVAGSPGTWVKSGGAPSGTAGGDLSGTYPNPTVANVHLATQSVSGTATLGASSAPVVLTDTTAAAFTLTLPAAPTADCWFLLIDDTGQWNTHNLTVGRNGKNIDGAASNLTLASQYGKVWLYYDGTAWWTLASWPASSSGAVASVTSADTSIVIGGTATNPTVSTATLNVIAADHPPAADWSNNSHKITSVANGSGAQDAVAYGQILPIAGGTMTGWLAPAVVALTDAATIAVDADDGNDFRVTLGGNRTLGNPSNPTDGQKIIFQVTQDGTGSRTLAYSSAYEFGTGLASPTLSTAASTTDLLGFIYNATKGKWLFVAFVSGFA